MKEKDFLRETIDNTYPTEAPDLDANEVLSRTGSARVKSRGIAGAVAVFAVLALTVGAVAVFNGQQGLETADSTPKTATMLTTASKAPETTTTVKESQEEAEEIETSKSTKKTTAKEKTVKADKKTTTTSAVVEEVATTTVPVNGITNAQALEIALKDAEFTKDQVTDIETETGHENGRDVFEVDFIEGNIKYEYDIDMITGDIISLDLEEVKNGKVVTEEKKPEPVINYIDSDEAIEKALKTVGVSRKDASDIELEVETTNGIRVYDIEIDVIKDNIKTEYSVEINAETGAVIKKDVETEKLSVKEIDDDDLPDDDEGDYDDDDDDDDEDDDD